jgi:hypothetical protein
MLPTHHDSPYPGLAPFGEAEAAVFFGREREVERLTANLLTSRLPLVYGPPGVGKTSVLRAGVMQRLRRQARENLDDYGAPLLAPIIHDSWRDGDPMQRLADSIAAGVAELVPDPPIRTGGPLSETIADAAAAVGGPIQVILDQLEEYFLLGRSDASDLVAELSGVLNHSDRHVVFLLSIREDMIASLIPLRESVPRLFDNFQRIEPLSRDAARAAILGPLETLAGHIAVEPDLVEAVLDQTSNVAVDRGRRVDPRTIELPFLQLVMTRLWDEEANAGAHALRLATLDRLGGAGEMLSTSVDDTMSRLSRADRDLAARLLRFLVTPSGVRVALTSADLAMFADAPPADVERVLHHLIDARLLRATRAAGERGAAPAYELFHDVLSTPLIAWQSRYTAPRSLRFPLRSIFRHR